jgi:hypothetical protein
MYAGGKHGSNTSSMPKLCDNILTWAIEVHVSTLTYVPHGLTQLLTDLSME